MFARRYNEIRLRLQIRPRSPLLIKDGRHHEEGRRERIVAHPKARRDPEKPRRREGRGYGSYFNADEAFDMACVWTQTADGPRFYIPGSSFKGLLRHGAEQLLSRWCPDLALAADPFENAAGKQVDEQRKAGKSPSSCEIYRQAGSIERCFGHPALRGRWSIADAWLDDEAEARLVVRDGVGIDRHSGAAAHNVKFQYEAISAGCFSTTLTIVNYELWQLGLLAHLLAAVDSGDLRLGYGARRGLGSVQMTVDRIAWQWYGRYNPNTAGWRIPSLSALMHEDNLASQYGLRDSSLTGIDLSAMTWTSEKTTVGKRWMQSPAMNTEGMDWDAAPWPQFAATLPDVVRNWPDQKGVASP
jgi:CRISPR/Cas system CSM-associated protein Csm3 (group 7 of RAMP superfamily)